MFRLLLEFMYTGTIVQNITLKQLQEVQKVAHEIGLINSCRIIGRLILMLKDKITSQIKNEVNRIRMLSSSIEDDLDFNEHQEMLTRYASFE